MNVENAFYVSAWILLSLNILYLYGGAIWANDIYSTTFSKAHGTWYLCVCRSVVNGCRGNFIQSTHSYNSLVSPASMQSTHEHREIGEEIKVTWPTHHTCACTSSSYAFYSSIISPHNYIVFFSAISTRVCFRFYQFLLGFACWPTAEAGAEAIH